MASGSRPDFGRGRPPTPVATRDRVPLEFGLIPPTTRLCHNPPSEVGDDHPDRGSTPIDSDDEGVLTDHSGVPQDQLRQRAYLQCLDAQSKVCCLIATNKRSQPSTAEASYLSPLRGTLSHVPQ